MEDRHTAHAGDRRLLVSLLWGLNQVPQLTPASLPNQYFTYLGPDSCSPCPVGGTLLPAPRQGKHDSIRERAWCARGRGTQPKLMDSNICEHLFSFLGLW